MSLFSKTIASAPIPDQESPKFPKPKILVVDCENDIVENLKSNGYNAVAGTFGRPYRVKVNDGFSPVIAQPVLPNLEEQEIVIIDLSPPGILSAPEGEKTVALGTKDVWASNQTGLIDPRPRVMFSAREFLNRIVAHGGVFIVFAEPVLHQVHTLAKASEFHGLYDERQIEIDNWTFLSLLDDDHIEKTRSAGTEVRIDGKPNAISTALARYLNDVRFSVQFQPTYRLHKDSGGAVFFSLAKNKFGDSVAGAIVMPDAKGTIFLLPHVADKSGLIAEFVESLLPNLHPHLFPFDETNNWLHLHAYEHPAVTKMSRDQEQIRKEAENAVAVIEAQINEERQRLGYLHRVSPYKMVSARTL